MQQHIEHQTKTGYSLLRVKAETRTRFDQLLQTGGTTLTDDDLLTLLLDEHDQRKSSTSDQQPA